MQLDLYYRNYDHHILEKQQGLVLSRQNKITNIITKGINDP